MVHIDFNKFKGMIFDFDGVILDSVDVKTSAFGEMYKQYGPEIENKVIEYHLQNGGVSRFEKFRYYQEVLLDKQINEKEMEELGASFNSLVFNKVISSSYIPGVKEFLKRYYSKKDLFVCTGTPETEILQIIEVLGIKDYFKEIFGSPAKKKEIIEKIMTTNDFKKNELVFFGDAMTDYEASKFHDIEFIGIASSEESPFPEGTFIVKSFLPLMNNL